MKRKELLVLGLIACFAVLIRVWFLSKVEVVIPDEAYYIGMGQSLAEGKDYAGFSPNPFQRSEATKGKHHGQPLLPYLFSLAIGWGGDPVRTCQWVSVMAGLLTLFLFHFCAKSLCSVKEALASDLFFCFLPFSIHYSILTMNHAVFNLFLVAAFFFVLKVQQSKRSLWAFLTGLTVWGAYLTRLEAFVFAALLAFVGICFDWPGSRPERATRFRWVMIFLITFLVLSVPVWIWIRKTTGIWQLDWTDRRETLTNLVNQWMAPLQTSSALLPYEHSLVDLHPLLNVAGYYFRNLMRGWTNMTQALPLPVWILIAFGGVEVFSRRNSSRQKTLLLAPFVFFPPFFYPVFGVESRYFHPSLIFLTLFSGAGIRFLYEKVQLKRLTQVFCVALLVPGFLLGYRGVLLGFKEEPAELKRLGEWIRSNYSTPQAFFLSDIRSCFYAGPACKRFVTVHEAKKHLAQGGEFKDFLRGEGVDLIIADTRYTKSLNPEFLFLLEAPPTYLKKIVEKTHGGEAVTLYELERDEGK